MNTAHEQLKDNITIRKIDLIESFIKRKYLLVDTKKYQIALLDNLWNIYTDEE